MNAGHLTALPVEKPLTPKERRCCVLLALGMNQKEIADRMETTEQVTKNRFREIYRKTESRGRVNLVIKLLRFKYEGRWA